MTIILATWELGRAFGHVAHVAPLARGLARRGIATAFAARDLLTASSLSDRPFARILQAPIHQRSVPRTPTLTYARAIADGGMADVDTATVLVAAWLQLIDGVRPDALSAEFAPASLLAAHVAGLPAVRVGTAWACPPASEPLPSLMPWLPDDPAARTAAGAGADDVVRTICRRFGAPLLDGLPALLAKSPRFLETWPEMDHYGAASGATYYGAMTGLAATARPAWPDASGPRTFVYIPGDHAGAVPLATALAALGWPTLWHGPTPPPDLASNIAYTAAPVDTAHILGEAALFAGRGGHATGCEAIRQACPQLVIPDTLETALLGWRLERQDLAKLLGERPAAANVQAALEALAADTRIAAAVTAASARYVKYDPFAAEDELARDIATAVGLA
ncbi:hypothetical protein KX816_01955 [Sphingosinicellaceae bacterium]|nr:hypothetical protein KX816_01955 [Sphingosinicellaceae bacterium]